MAAEIPSMLGASAQRLTQVQHISSSVLLVSYQLVATPVTLACMHAIQVLE